jgi:hypothetical protein
MDDSDPQPIDELQQLLDEMEAHAPKRDLVAGKKIVFRQVGEDDALDDSLTSEELDDDIAVNVSSTELTDERPPISQFQPTLMDGPVAAVDCGIIRLGETENGLIIALRASIVIDDGTNSKIRLFRTGPLYLHNAFKAQTLYQMGKHLGKPDFFVDLDESDPQHPTPIKVKSGVAGDTHQYGDRFRNWFERLVQKVAVASVENGIVLFDGALTLRTRDTPQLYLKDLGKLAGTHGNAIIAISKQSLLQVGGRSIRFWLNDTPNHPCYRLLSDLMRREGAEIRSLGHIYAVRFSVLGPTLRMDVVPLSGQSDNEAIGQLHSSVLMRGGYPDILVRAHAHSYFTSPDVIQLQAQAGAKYSLVPEGEVELTGIFGPFGGRFK